MKKYNIRKTFTYEGKRYQIYGDTEAQVAAKMALRIRDLEENRVTYDSSMLVKDWANVAIEAYKTNQSEVTRNKYVARVRHNVLEHVGSMKLKDVKPIMLQNTLNLCSGCSQRHINEVYQIITFLFSTAYDNGMLRTDPSKHLRKPSGAPSQSREATPEEVGAFKKAAAKDDRFILYELIYYCGCRPSEAMEAKVSDITIMEGKPVLHIRATKNHYSDRIVPVPQSLYERVLSSSGYIAPHNGKKHSRTSYRRLTDALYRAMDIELGARVYRNQIVEHKLASDFVPYCLRHSFCTNLARKGVDVRVAQKLMGHSNIQTTVNIYTHVDNTLILDAIRALEPNDRGSE